MAKITTHNSFIPFKVRRYDKRGAVRAGEREVRDIVISAVRAGPLPLEGRHGFNDFVSLAYLAGLAAAEQILETAPAVGLAEAFPEKAVGKGHMIIRAQEHNICRQSVQNVAEPLPLGSERFDRFLQLHGSFLDLILQRLSQCFFRQPAFVDVPENLRSSLSSMKGYGCIEGFHDDTGSVFFQTS